MVALLPYTSAGICVFINTQAASRFNTAHHFPQCFALQLDQSMKVIWHNHPCLGSHNAFVMREPELIDNKSAGFKVTKKRASILSDCGQQIEATRFRITSDMQTIGVFGSRQSFALLIRVFLTLAESP